MDGLQVLTFFGVVILVALETMKLAGSIQMSREMRNVQSKEISLDELKELIEESETEEKAGK